MMKTLLFTAALIACVAQADDRVRDVQAELKTQGFYYGEVDGKASDETSSAVRRFQIRNGLKVTGKVDDETLGSLGLAGEKKQAPAAPEPPKEWEPAAPKKTPQVNPTPVIPDDEMERPSPNKSRDLLLREREGDPQPQSDPRILRGLRQDPAFVEPPRPIPGATLDAATIIFRGTPYATAPRELQEDTIAAAQRILQRERMYRGEVDGFAGQMTSEALFNYQEKYAMRPTGRLDLETLARMNLLPRVVPAPGARPFYNPNQRRDRTVFGGSWVR